MNHVPSISPDNFHLKDLVELRGTDGPTRGRVVATQDEATWIHVLWRERPGHEGKVTKEQPTDLRKLSRTF
jgi:hypothetical protein